MRDEICMRDATLPFRLQVRDGIVSVIDARGYFVLVLTPVEVLALVTAFAPYALSYASLVHPPEKT